MKIILSLFLTLFSVNLFASSIQTGQVSVTDQRQTVSFSGFDNPVIIAGIATNNDPEQGIVTISNVTANSFDIEFKEWPYLDNVHQTETVAYLIIEEGRHTLNDGSVWEAKKVVFDQQSQIIEFEDSFDTVPQVFLSAHLSHTTYAARASSVTRFAFKGKLSAQESAVNYEHQNVEVSYLAVSSSSNEGALNDGTSYATKTTYSTPNTATTIFGVDLFVQEETSSDSEVFHISEALSVLRVNNYIFASDNSVYGSDAFGIRYAISTSQQGNSCKQIKVFNPSAESGIYFIDPDGAGSIQGLNLYCDMESGEGGWTLISTYSGSPEECDYTSPYGCLSSTLTAPTTTQNARLSDEFIYALINNDLDAQIRAVSNKYDTVFKRTDGELVFDSIIPGNPTEFACKQLMANNWRVYVPNVNTAHTKKVTTWTAGTAYVGQTNSAKPCGNAIQFSNTKWPTKQGIDYGYASTPGNFPGVFYVR